MQIKKESPERSDGRLKAEKATDIQYIQIQNLAAYQAKWRKQNESAADEHLQSKEVAIMGNIDTMHEPMIKEGALVFFLLAQESESEEYTVPMVVKVSFDTKGVSIGPLASLQDILRISYPQIKAMVSKADNKCSLL